MKENFVTIEGIAIDLGKITSYIISPNQMIRLTFMGGNSLVFFTPDIEGDAWNEFLNEKQLISCDISKEKLKSLSEFFDNRFNPKKLNVTATFAYY